MKKNFDFVNVTSPGGRSDAQYRRQVHVQAMRSFRRQQRLQDVEAHERATREAAARNEQEANEDLAESIVLNQSAHVGRCLVDPFKALPVGFDEHQDLLGFFQIRIGPMLLPDDAHQPTVSWSTQWLRTAVEFPTMLAATCCHAAVFLDDVQGKEHSTRTIRLQGQTIRSLNASLEKGVGDEAIGAVLMLVANSVWSYYQKCECHTDSTADNHRQRERNAGAHARFRQDGSDAWWSRKYWRWLCVTDGDYVVQISSFVLIFETY